jgi:hypothetical protein
VRLSSPEQTRSPGRGPIMVTLSRDAVGRMRRPADGVCKAPYAEIDPTPDARHGRTLLRAPRLRIRRLRRCR